MLLRAVDVFDIYVEPFIHSGFRLPNQPYSYYYRSLFSLHNETLSIWTHLFGTIILIVQAFQQISQLSINLYSTIQCIYIIYNCIGACIMLLCSAQAHLFHSRTLADHLRSFYLDYFGINFYGFTSGIILYRFSHKQKFSMFTNETSYYLILSFLSLYSLSIACFCKTFYRRPYPYSHKFLQCSSVLILYLFQIWPILKNIFFTFILYDNNQELIKFEEKALFWHLIQIISFILSGLIFVGRVPERFCPGLFDLFGQSHHTFHLTIFLMSFSQANAVFEDMHSMSLNNIQYNLMKDILYTLIVLILELITVVIWFRISRPTIERRYKIDFKNE
ncbi:unnamed protein product [Rotaria sordida]|uniref:Uncharacterized protein n=1 Tax=Rotaria sordida TaxID=392033 RepID=A0A813S6N3_9BILA|nr:unnamed protein product [Rotaria sordida]CAF1038492.1 unnamed protein product [Rotaria sordida]CAF1156939.1 unnamed protein product [Rotaria sordida]CAF1432988.1 unnamed protein product [Rotaria sordida]CAF3808000.1 unnamed protein product [Rotaria sordida]